LVLSEKLTCGRREIALTCFALGSMHYGEVRSGRGAVGPLVFLALFEFLERVPSPR
jgi:hypothetical protein